MTAERRLGQAAKLIQEAEALLITAGAGMGVDSGLPDFRGSEGLWRAYPALGRARMDFQTIASPANFKSNPRLAWGFYGHRLQLYRSTTPHAGFELLRQWGESKPGGYFVFTSNVDGQFQKAGFDPRRIEECHGSIHHVQCSANCCENIWPADDIEPSNIDPGQCLWNGPLPLCPNCGAVLRPNILMFDDWRWNPLRQSLQRKRRDEWLMQSKGRRIAVIELGAGTAIPSVRRFGMTVASQSSQHLIRVNPREIEMEGPRIIGIPLPALPALGHLSHITMR